VQSCCRPVDRTSVYTQRVRSRGGNAERLKSLGVSSPRTQIRHISAKFRCEVARSSETRKLSGEQFLNLGPDFARNWWTLVHIFRRRWKALGKGYMPPKFCGPKFRNKKVIGWPNFKLWARFRFSRNWWTLVHIFWRCWKALGKGYKPQKFCWPKFRNKKIIGWSNFELQSRFSRNWWTLVYIFWHFWKALQKDYKTPKLCGPKFKNKKKLCGVKFWQKFRFSRNCWTLVHIFWRFWIALGKGYKPLKLCGPKFRNKKVIGWSNFDLWSRFSRNRWTLVHIFWHFWKALQNDYNTSKVCGPKIKNKKVMQGQILTKIPIFLKLVKFGPHFPTLLESTGAVIQRP